MGIFDWVYEANINRAETFADKTARDVQAISSARGDVYITPYTVEVKSSDLNARLTIPAADTTPMPVYEEPGVAMPIKPELVELGTVTDPVMPVSPTVTTTGLFEQIAPSSDFPEWTEANPNLHVDEILAELNAVAQPILNDITIPGITPFSLSAPPDLMLPEYTQTEAPESIGAATNYADYMLSRYNAALPEMQAFIDEKVETWINKYAPELEESRSRLHDKLMTYLNSQVLPDQFEAALMTRARSRVAEEYDAAEKAVREKRTGFLVSPGAIYSGVNKVILGRAKSLSVQSNEIYLERRRSEVQHLQFVLNLIAQQINSVRALSMQSAQNTLATLQQANTHADAITAKLMVLFEHERSRREFSLAVMREMNAQFEVKLKAALSGLEGYKLELQAEELRANVEAKQIEAAKLQLEAQQQLVSRYSAIVEAITKKIAVVELQLKEYDTREKVLELNIKSRLAAFEAFKAGIDGDKGKLDGERIKVELYNAELKGKELELEVQTKRIEANAKTNQAKQNIYEGEQRAYSIASNIALQKFTAGAEIKKMGLELWGKNLDANIAAFEGDIKLDVAWIEAQLSQYKYNTDAWMSAMQLEEKYTELAVHKAIAVATADGNIASASAQAAQAAASVATQG